MSTQPHDAPAEVLNPSSGIPAHLLPDPIGDPPEPDVEALLAELENLDLPTEDGQPLETYWHSLCIDLLLDSVKVHMGNRTDYFVGGNMFIYFSLQQVRNRDYRGPDFFFVDQVPHTPIRDSWVVWNEGGRYPNTIIELTSPSTANEDRTTKFRIYEQVFQTKDYFIYDRLTQRLEGWHLGDDGYKPLEPNEQGRLWCSSLHLWVGRWKGIYSSYDDIWLRFFDTRGEVVPSSAEFERLWAEEQRRLAEEQQRRADEQQRRADAAEAELARMHALLAAQQKAVEEGKPGSNS